jgi:hypothetical protein
MGRGVSQGQAMKKYVLSALRRAITVVLGELQKTPSPQLSSELRELLVQYSQEKQRIPHNDTVRLKGVIDAMDARVKKLEDRVIKKEDNVQVPFNFRLG